MGAATPGPAGPGDAVILCGVRIPHDKKLIGHSDADVGMHALTDALLGTIADGDIGVHFPPSDARWRGVASEVGAIADGKRAALPTPTFPRDGAYDADPLGGCSFSAVSA